MGWVHATAPSARASRAKEAIRAAAVRRRGVETAATKPAKLTGLLVFSTVTRLFPRFRRTSRPVAISSRNETAATTGALIARRNQTPPCVMCTAELPKI